jgi:acetylornithine deacetylase/succinyl-diaminopimelate desuccinylase-like protein
MLLMLAGAAPAHSEALRDQVRSFRQANEKAILGEFVEMLSIPNVATNTADIDRNVIHLRKALARRGFLTQVLSPGAGLPSSLYGELNVPSARRTVIFYAHFDGQPVDQPDWSTSPWQPTMRTRDGSSVDLRAAARIDPEWRLHGRSTSDDKVAIQALLSALDALSAAGRQPSVNVKVFLEGEEEIGSPNLKAVLAASRELLKADLFVLGDGPRHQSGQMQVTYGARGVTAVELTTYGPRRPLHDGHYGNWAPNPASRMARLLASLRDDDGRILIPGFYSDVRKLGAAETRMLRQLPDVEADLKSELLIAESEGGKRLGDAISLPALNIRGIRVGDVGRSASNTIQPEARASIDFRLVPDQDPARVKERTEAFLRSQGWVVLDREPTPEELQRHPRIVRASWGSGYPAYRSDPEDPAARALVRAIEGALGSSVLQAPMVGGSVPMHLFAEALNLPVVFVPLANHDNNQHAANENLRIQNLWDGIEIYAGMLGSLDW